MNLFNQYGLLYLVSNAFRMFVIYRFMNIFFDTEKVENSKQILAYMMYFSLNSSAHILFNNPNINLLTNILLLFFLTYVYKAKFASRLVSVSLICAVNLFWDGIIFVISTHYNFTSLIITTGIAGNLMSFFTALLIKKTTRLKTSYYLSAEHWMAIAAIPIGSIFISIVLMTDSTIPSILSVCMLLAINILIFFLYNSLLKSYNERHEKEMLEQQNNAYHNQFNIIKESQEKTRILKHDIKNHMFKVKYFAEKCDFDGIIKYIDTAVEQLTSNKEFVCSGNNDFDSILNYKLVEFEKIGTELSISVNIPISINIDSFDINVIIGNLLDNALTAIKGCIDKKLGIDIEVNKNILYISISNTYSGELSFEDGKLVTTKKDNLNHGIGLMSAEYAAQKYNGCINIEHNN
ncbi:MAG: GHKL domain-containing protein, partial [Oscillospiraceae bacterium]